MGQKPRAADARETFVSQQQPTPKKENKRLAAAGRQVTVCVCVGWYIYKHSTDTQKKRR